MNCFKNGGLIHDRLDVDWTNQGAEGNGPGK